MNVRRWIPLLKDAYAAWSEDEASRLAAALAYYAAFALAPLMIVVIEIGALLLGGSGHHHVVRDAMLSAIKPALGDAATKAVGALVQATFDQRSKGTIASIIGWVVFIAAATGLFGSVQSALDTVWHVEKTKTGIAGALKDRLVSFGLIAGVTLVLLASFVVNAGLTAFSTVVAQAIPGWSFVIAILDVGVSFAVVGAVFAALFKYLPKTDLTWHDVLFGAAVTSALFLVGQYLIGLYLGRVSTTSTYGAAGSFVAILLWLYYSGQIFLFGAELTKVYATRFGSKVAPTAVSHFRS